MKDRALASWTRHHGARIARAYAMTATPYLALIAKAAVITDEYGVSVATPADCYDRAVIAALRGETQHDD